MSAECPTPWNVRYTTRQFAKNALNSRSKAVRSQQTRKGQPRPYPCVCGFWHVSSMSRTVFKRQRRRAA